MSLCESLEREKIKERVKIPHHINLHGGGNKQGRCVVLLTKNN
jgi:hypothetical protein